MHHYPDNDEDIAVGTVYWSVLAHFRRITTSAPYYGSEPVAPGVIMPSQKRLLPSSNTHEL